MFLKQGRRPLFYGRDRCQGALPPDLCSNCPDQGQNLYAAMDVNGNCATNGIDITFYVAYLKGIQPALRYCQSCPPARLAAVPGDRPVVIPSIRMNKVSKIGESD